MNLIVNLIEIENSNQLAKYGLEINQKSILSLITSQVATSSIGNIIFIIRKNIAHQLENLVTTMGLTVPVSYKLIASDSDEFTAYNLLSIDTAQAYRTFRSINLKEFFEGNLVDTKSTILLDGTKFYKRDTFNFSEAKNDVIVKIMCDCENRDGGFLLFIKDTKFDYTLEIKKIHIEDYKYNFINMLSLKTILESSQEFATNKKLAYEYIIDSFENFNFTEALVQVEEQAENNAHWAMLYLEFLIGFGSEQEFLRYYHQKKTVLHSYEFTNTQLAMYKNIFKLFNSIEGDQEIILAGVKELIKEPNVNIDNILNLINNEPNKEFNLAYLSINLIEKNILSEEQAIALLNEIEMLNVNPFIKIKNIVEICDYFILTENISKLSNNLLNELFKHLLRNSNLCEKGLKVRTQMYKNRLKIEPVGEACINRDINTVKRVSANPKIAVCISGMAKYDYEKNLELIVNRLKHLDVDYFVQAWDRYEQFPGLAEYQQTPDFNWASQYLTRLRRLQPIEIQKQGKFEQLLPKTAKLLLSKNYQKVSGNDYAKYFCQELKVIKKYDYQKAVSKITMDRKNYKQLSDKMIKYFERSIVNNLLEEYIEQTATQYDYVMNIDVNTSLKRELTTSEILNINDDSVYIFENQNSDGLTTDFSIAKYNTAKYMNSLWNICRDLKTVTPYKYLSNQNKDDFYDPMLLHLLNKNLLIKTNFDDLGAPYINKRILFPKIADAISEDIKIYEGDKHKVQKYFGEVERIYSKIYPYNTNYKLIHNVQLLEARISEKGVIIDISITGDDLRSIAPTDLYLFGKSKMSLDSTYLQSRLYKKNFNFLKHENNEVIVRREISDKELFVGKDWSFSLLLQDSNVSYFPISFEPCDIQYELTKYGMKYIKCTDQFSSGIKSKSYFLK